MKTPFQRVPFGVIPAGSTLTFHVLKAKGFEATASLMRGNTQVASWESIELVGEVVNEIVIPPGIYKLNVTIPFTSKAGARVTVDISVDVPEIEPESVVFKGVRDDIGSILVDFVILDPEKDQ